MKINALSKRYKAFFGLTLVLASLVFVHYAKAAMDKYDPGANIVLGEFVYDNSYVATTSGCTISIYDPVTGNPAVSGFLMTALSNGWHYYSTSTLYTEGTWPATMTCGTSQGGDLATIDKTFIVGYTSASTTQISNAVWNNSASSSIAAAVNANTNAVVTAASSSIISSVNSNTNAIVTAASSSIISSLPGLIWRYSGKTLDNFGSLVSDIVTGVWGYLGTGGRTLTSALLGNGSGTLALQSDINSASTSLASAITASTNSINGNIYSASTSLSSTINAGVASTAAVLAENNAMIQTLDNTNAVWAYLGEVLHSSQVGAWAMSLSDTGGAMTAGQTLRSTVYVTYQWNAANSYAAPVMKIYDPNRFIATSGPMTETGTGIYEFDYSIPGNATAGQWESVVDAQVQAGQNLETSDYWTLQPIVSPPMVAINGITSDIIPNISTNVTIKNEGTEPNEYQYEWCVVANINDGCESGNAISYDMKSQLLQPGQIINPDLASTVPVAGDYYFKLVVYYGGDQPSHGSQYFTAINPTTPPPPSNPPPGGGFSSPGPSAAPVTTGSSNSDFNGDEKVDSIDFSILLYYWHAKPPFGNKFVDINKDGKVDSVDFSILLYEWGK